MIKSYKAIGIIGGMGPFASSYFYELLIKKSSDSYGAKNNDEFPEILIDSIPVPDFISNINNLNIAKKMLSLRIKRLDSLGVSCFGMVCNTGHVIYNDLAGVSKSEFVSMINLGVIEAAKSKYKKVGVLATPTTIKFDLYGKALSNYGIEVVYPSKRIQKLHEKIIRQAIEGKRKRLETEGFVEFVKRFIRENNLDSVILGCTELPLIFPKRKFNGRIIDPMDLLADKLLNVYYKDIKVRTNKSNKVP